MFRENSVPKFNLEDPILELKFILFEDSSLIGSFLQYLKELKKLNEDVFKGFCQKMESGEITSATELFQDFELVNKNLNLNITKADVQNLEINIDAFLNKQVFITWCLDLNENISEEQLVEVIKDALAAEKKSVAITGFFYEGSMNEWEAFWKNESSLVEKDKQQLKNYAENALCIIAAKQILAASKEVPEIFAASNQVPEVKELKDILFKSTFLTDAFVNYLDELHKLDEDVLDCLHYRMVEGNLNADEFSYSQRLFMENFALDDDRYELKITAPSKKKKEGEAPVHKATDFTYTINYVTYSAKPEFKKMCLKLDKTLTSDSKQRIKDLNELILAAFRLQNQEEAYARRGSSRWDNCWEQITLDGDDKNQTKKKALKAYAEECICFSIRLNIESTINSAKAQQQPKEKKKGVVHWVKSHSAIFEGSKKERPAKKFSTSSPESSTGLNPR